MKPRSFRPRSIAATTMRTSGWSRVPRSLPWGAADLERRLDLDILRGEILRRLVGQEQCDLVDELAEVDGRRVLVAKVRELVLDERVLDLDDVLRPGFRRRRHAAYFVQPRKSG